MARAYPFGMPFGLVFEWVMHEYRILAFGAGRQQCNRTADQFLDPRYTSAEAIRDPRQSDSTEPSREQGQGSTVTGA